MTHSSLSSPATICPPTPYLSWALVISTYRRQHILPRCLKLAATQTYPPKEIIVVDASPDWDSSRELVTEALFPLYPLAQLTYVHAHRPSLTAQRNQGIDLATADVVFLIDDDSLMYPDCAAEVMKVYQADVAEQVKGVQCLPMAMPPDLPVAASAPLAQALPRTGFGQPASPHHQAEQVAMPPRQTWLRRLVKAILNNEKTYFLPYDQSPPAYEIPAPLAALNVGVVPVMAGYAMTFRRNIVQQERFSEVLERYAACEDQDLSYRVSRHGMILNALDARLCHLEISGGRLSLYTVMVLAGLNAAVLQQFHSSDRAYTQRAWRKILQKRIVISGLKEISERRWTFPRTRGYLFARSQLNAVYAKSLEELQDWYPQFQQQLIAANRQ